MERWKDPEEAWGAIWLETARRLARSVGKPAAADWAGEAVTLAWFRFRRNMRPWREVRAWCFAVGAKLACGAWRLHRGWVSVTLLGDLGLVAPLTMADEEWVVLEGLRASLGPLDATTLSMLLAGAAEAQIAAARAVTERSVRASSARIRAWLVAGEE